MTVVVVNNFIAPEISQACQLGNIHKLQSLLKKNPALVTGCDIEGNTLLTLACRENRLKIVELLLNHPYNADINQCNQLGYSPLITAATEGHLAVIELLLSKGAFLDQQNANGWTALMCACCFRRIEIVKVLLNTGANVNVVSNTGCSALYLACSSGNDKIVELLLQYSADVNLCSNSGCSPLHLASEQSQKTIIQLLIDYGASISQLDHHDRTPLQVARTEDVRQLIRTAYEESIMHPKPKKLMPPKKPPRRSTKKESEAINPSDIQSQLNVPDQPDENREEQKVSLDLTVVPSSNDISTSLLPNTPLSPQSPPLPQDLADLVKQLSSLNYDNLQHLSQTTASSLHYLTNFSQQTLSLQYEWKYIQSQPFLAEYYSYCQRCFTSVILSLQVLLSNNVADNRTSLLESIFIKIDAVIGASGVNFVPLVSGLIRYLVSIPYAVERRKTIENITQFFPSISSHQVIDLLIHELTLLEESNIRQVMKLNKTIKKRDLIYKLYENHQLIAWMYEEICGSNSSNGGSSNNRRWSIFSSNKKSSEANAPSSSSSAASPFSYSIIQAYADIQLSRIFSRLMEYHHQKNQTVATTNDEIPLFRRAITPESLWHLECIALDLPLTEINQQEITDRLQQIHERFYRKRLEQETITTNISSDPMAVSPHLERFDEDISESKNLIEVIEPPVVTPEYRTESKPRDQRPISVRYQVIIQSLEEKILNLQTQLSQQLLSSDQLVSQQQEEILAMKAQLQRMAQLQEQQQEQLLSGNTSPSGITSPHGSSRRTSTAASNQLLLHKQVQSTTDRSEGIGSEAEDGEVWEVQRKMMMHQAYMTETLYEIIQQVQILQEQLPGKSYPDYHSARTSGLEDVPLSDGSNRTPREFSSERSLISLDTGCCVLQ